jgi:hypothetical protein
LEEELLRMGKVELISLFALSQQVMQYGGKMWLAVGETDVR